MDVREKVGSFLEVSKQQWCAHWRGRSAEEPRKPQGQSGGENAELGWG